MRPAERRTIERGMMMRAVAIVRAIWKTSGVSPPSIIGVPSIFTYEYMHGGGAAVRGEVCERDDTSREVR